MMAPVRKGKQPKAIGRVRGPNGQFEKKPANRVQRNGKNSRSRIPVAGTPTPASRPALEEKEDRNGEGREETVVMKQAEWEAIQTIYVSNADAHYHIVRLRNGY